MRIVHPRIDAQGARMDRSADGERPRALVTGASYGVGAAIAQALAGAGCDLVLTARHAARLAATAGRVEAAGGRALTLPLDLRSQTSIAEVVATAARELGGVDLLVNNAAANLRRRAVDVTPAEWSDVIDTNLTGTFFITQAVARRMIGAGRGGAIVNIASVHGMITAAERSAYGISKAALIQMTRMLAIEWAQHGIRVNAVAPGRLITESPQRAQRTNDPGYMAAMVARVPLGRLATVEEVVGAVCWLASPGAAAVTGHVMVMDGGLTVV